MSTAQVDFGGWMREAFELYKNNFVTIVIAGLLAALLSVFTVGILAGPMAAGLAIILLGLLDRVSPRPEIGDLFRGLQFFLPSFLVFLVTAAASTACGMVFGPLAPVATLLVGALTMFAYLLIVERKLDFWPAIIGSYELVKVQFWPLLGLYVVGAVIAAAGTLACCVGAIVTMPFASCLVAVAYRHLSGGPASVAASAPPTRNVQGETIRLDPPVTGV